MSSTFLSYSLNIDTFLSELMSKWIFPEKPDESAIESIKTTLDSLTSSERLTKRSEITNAITADESNRLVILSGPGTGKTHLFLERIRYLLNKDVKSRVLVTTFVKKLADDLQNRINQEPDVKGKAESKTLHSFAFDLLKKSTPYSTYRKIFDNLIMDEIWLDIRFILNITDDNYSLPSYQRLIHDLELTRTLSSDKIWKMVDELYLKFISFYQAISFDDQIRFAHEELTKNEIAIDFNNIIVDEYQDFNKLENEFINLLSVKMKSTLFAGDDDQVLYGTLKNAHREYIRSLYDDDNFSKTFLPFCSRCSNNITRVASYFIENQDTPDPERINKIFFPIATEDEHPKVKIIASYNGDSTVHFFKEYIKAKNTEIAEVNEKLQNNDTTVVPFLFVISPILKKTFLDRFKGLKEEIEQNQHIYPHLTSETYKYLLNCIKLSKNKNDNLAFRNIISTKEIENPSQLVRQASEESKNLCDLSDLSIKEILRESEQIKMIIEENDIDDFVSITEKLFSIESVKILASREGASKERLENEIKEFKLNLENIDKEGLNAVELLSYPKCKGLSADHVFIIGFDNTFMDHITTEAFFVGLTRARKSLTLIMTAHVGATGVNKFLEKFPNNNLDFFKYTKGKGLEQLTNKDKLTTQISTWQKYSSNR